MFDSRNNLSNQVVADVRQFMGAKVYKTMIPRNVRISEAPSYGKPVLVYDLKCIVLDRCKGDSPAMTSSESPSETARRQTTESGKTGGESMARSLSIVGFLALAIGLLWIGQGTGTIRWPTSSFMINELQWAGYGALLGAIGLILIWQGNR